MGAQVKQETVSQYLNRFVLDVRRKDVLCVKLLNFLLIAGVATIFMFSTVHMSSLGITMEEISVLNAVLPVLSFLSMPLVGGVTDKIGNPKLTACTVYLLTAVSHLAMLLVPAREASTDGSSKFDATLVRYFIIRGVSGIFLPIMLMCTDAITLSVSRARNAEYNFQKFYGSLSGCISPPLVGIIMDRVNQGTGKTDFSVAFYLFAVSQILCFVVVALIKEDPVKKTDSKGAGATTTASELFKNPAVFAFLLMALVGGAYWQFIDAFGMLFLDELGASKSFFGLRASVAGLSGVFLTLFSGFIIQKFGAANLFASSLFCYVIRLTIYSFAQDPYHILYTEALEGVSFALFIVSITTYTVRITPPHLMGSVQGMVMGLFMGLGRATGSLVGGVLVSLLGSRASFQFLAVVALLLGSSYITLYNSWLKNVEPRYDEKEDHNKNKKKL